MRHWIATAMAFAILIAGQTSAVAAEKTLRITLQLPLKHHLGQNLLNFKEEVERESGRSLKIEIYPSAQ